MSNASGGLRALAVGSGCVLVMIVLVATACMASLRSQDHALREMIAKAEQEEKRLEYVWQQHDSLIARRQAAIDALRARGEVIETRIVASPLESPLPSRTPSDGLLTTPATIRAHQQELDGLTARIQKGINLEKHLPELAREVAELEDRRAAPVARTTPP